MSQTSSRALGDDSLETWSILLAGGQPTVPPSLADLQRNIRSATPVRGSRCQPGTPLMISVSCEEIDAAIAPREGRINDLNRVTGKELLWLDRLLSQSNRDLGVRDDEERHKMRIRNEGSKGSWIIHLEFFILLSTFPLLIPSSLIIHKAACGIHHRSIGHEIHIIS